jgi:hypothetical protein
MATDIAGLFGITPDMYGQQQRQAALNEGIGLARLAPEDRAQAMIYSGAAGLGRAGGGLLGAEDPQLKLIAARQSIMNQLDQTNPESMLKGAQTLAQMGDQQGAFALADYARKAESEIAQAKQRMAAANRERQQAVPEKIQIADRLSQLNMALDKLNELEASPDRDAAIRNVSRSIKAIEQQLPKEQADKLSAFGQTLVDAGLQPGTEPFQKRMLEYATEKAKGAGKGTGNVTIGGITVDTGTASKEAGKIIGQNVANVEQQYSLQTAYKDAITLLDQGIYGGAIGPEKQFIAKYTGIGDPKKVQNTEVFMANIGEIVIPRLQQFGGNDSNEELKYLQNVVAGNQRLEPESMKRILNSAEKKVQKNIERLRQQTQAGEKGAQLPITPVNVPTVTPTKRLNPQTGKIENVKGD